MCRLLWAYMFGVLNFDIHFVHHVYFKAMLEFKLISIEQVQPDRYDLFFG